MSPLLRAAGLTRRYGGLAAVDKVDLDLFAGDRRALIGPNGAGKSTLLGLLAGTVRPSAGRVWLDGTELTRAGPERRARLGLARTFQTPAVLDSLSALDNVRVGAWRRSGRSGARHALAGLDALGLAGLARMPAGALSHGQRRLLEIAMALAADPAVLLLDEPAAGLGEADLPRLLAALGRLPAAMAVLLVEHNQQLVSALARTVTVLHQGRVLATGMPDQVRAQPAVAAVYLGTEPVAL